MGTRLVWALIAGLAVAGCGDDVTDPSLLGTFEAFVSGEFSQELTGTAQFGLFTNEGFGLSMLPTIATQSVGIGHGSEVRPAVGTYAIGAPDAQTFFGLYVRQMPEGMASFVSQSGQLVITSSSAARLEGTFDFMARGSLVGDPFEREVRIEGTFSATCAAGARCE